MRIRDVLKSAPVQIFLWIWTAIVTLPLLWVLVSSFKSDSEIFSSPWTLPGSWRLENFSRAWFQSDIGAYFLNTVIVVGLGLTLCLTLSSLAAYVLARFAFRGRQLIYYLFVGGMAFPTVLALVPLFFVMRDLRLIDTHLGAAIAYAAFSMPFSVFFLTAFFRVIPNELAEAAIMDGCGHARVFWSIMLPMARPGLIAVGIFDFLGMWNQYVLPLVLISSPEKYVVAQGLANLAVQQGYASDFSGMFAGMVIATIPVLVVYFFFQRQLTQGMMAGAIR